MFALPSQLDPQNIKKFTKHVRETSVPEFSWFDEFYQTTLKHILEQKNFLGFEHSKCLSQLLIVLYQKITEHPRILNQYPSISKTMSALVSIVDSDFFQEILNKLDGKAQQDIEQNKEPQILRNFQLSKQNCSKGFRDNQLQKYQKNNKIERNQNLLDKSTFQTDTGLKQDKRSIDCIGCFQYLYQKKFISLNNQKQVVIVFPSAKTIRNFQMEIKNAICNLLNNNGGFILFACNYNTNLVAYGQSISEVKKQSILQQFIQLFSCFVPKPNFSTNAQLSFVPIAKNSQELVLIECLFVTRLKIGSNNQKQLLTFYNHMGQLLTSYGPRQQNQSNRNQLSVYKHRCILRQIKRRFKQKYKNKIISLASPLLYQPHDYDPLSHKCKKPQVSKNLVSTYMKDIDNSSLFDLQKKYKYTSIIILQKITTSKVINLLTSQNISRFQFMPPGTEYNDEIRLLFHDTSPHKLKQILESYKIQKGLLRLLLLDNALQLKSPLHQAQYMELFDFLSKTLSFNSTLKYYISKKDNSYFLGCQYKTQIYYVFNKLRQMNFHGSRLVRLDSNSSNIQKIFSF